MEEAPGGAPLVRHNSIFGSDFCVDVSRPVQVIFRIDPWGDPYTHHLIRFTHWSCRWIAINQ